MRRVLPALATVALAAVLTGCVAEPEPAPTPLTVIEACDALQDAVLEFYDIASPNSTVTELETHDLPDINGFRIPKPTCAFQVRPDPAVIPGNVFTIENFYLDYPEEMTLTIGERLESAGFKRTDSPLSQWGVTQFGHVYSAAMLVYMPGDGQGYSEAVEHYRLLDLSIGQN
ncbi:MAG: hypothetical protein ABI566_00895 [Pseudolysinimonas sp.]